MREWYAKGVPFGTPVADVRWVVGLGDVLRFVAADSFGHLVLQSELPLLQRLFFHLLVDGDLRFGRQFTQAIFTLTMFFGPGTELGICVGEDALNLCGIRHRWTPPSEVPIRDSNSSTVLRAGIEALK